MKARSFARGAIVATLCAFGTNVSAASVCRFESLPDNVGKTLISGTVTKTSTGAIVEYDSGVTLALVCKPAPSQCSFVDNFSRTVVDFSYAGFMIVNTRFPDLDMDTFGLVRLACQN